MTTYTAVTDTETGHLKPVTTSLLRRLRDNPIAVAEGATGAPRIMPAALDLYLGSFDISGATYVGLSGLDGLDGIMVAMHIVTGGATTGTRFRLSSDGGSTWGGNILIGSIVSSAASGLAIFYVSLKTPRALVLMSPIGTTAAGRTTSYTIPGSGANAIQFSFTTGAPTAQAEAGGIGSFS